MLFFLGIPVHFVEHQTYRYPISLCRCQKTVDEDSRCFRIIYGHNQQTLIQIGSNDMRLFRQVGSPSDDVILPVFYFGDKCRTFRVGSNFYIVTHGNGVGASDPFQTEVSLYLAFYQLVVFCLDQVPASGIFYN